MATTQKPHHINPFKEFLKRGRRRTDNPWVIGYIALALLFMCIVQALTMVVTWATGNQVQLFLTDNADMQKESLRVRSEVIAVIHKQNQSIYALCVMTAKTKEAQQLCAPPPIPPSITQYGKVPPPSKGSK